MAREEDQVSREVSTFGRSRRIALTSTRTLVFKRLINDTLMAKRWRPRRFSRREPLGRRNRRARALAFTIIRGVPFVPGHPTRLALNRTIINCPEKTRLVYANAILDGMHSRRHVVGESLALSRETHTSAGRDLFTGGTRAHLTPNPQLRISCRQCVAMNLILPALLPPLSTLSV